MQIPRATRLPARSANETFARSVRHASSPEPLIGLLLSTRLGRKHSGIGSNFLIHRQIGVGVIKPMCWLGCWRTRRGGVGGWPNPLISHT